MTDTAHYDLCVIGGGSGGMGVAVGAALLGVPVALVDPGPPGADGSEELARAALLAAAAAIQTARAAPGLGPLPAVDLDQVRRHVAQALEKTAAASAPERLRALGIHLIEGRARFLAPDRVATDGSPRILTARRFVVASGGVRRIPALPGLDRVPFLLPAELAARERLPTHLVVLGDGAEALELAQAYRRLGAAVTLIAGEEPLPGHDPELVDLLLIRLRVEGVRVLTGDPVGPVARNSSGIVFALGTSDKVTASDVLVAGGRQAALEGLDLAMAGIELGPDGIRVDRHLRTSNRRVYALGDAIGGPAQVQDVTAQAGVILRQVLFRQNAAFDPAALPRVVRTGPGLAQIGLTEQQARTAVGRITILRSPMHDNDRARAEGAAHGLVKVVTDGKGRILGAGILAPRADELITPWQLALAQKLKIGAIANLPAAYPTLGEASKRAAGSFLAPRLLSAKTRKWVRWLAIFG